MSVHIVIERVTAEQFSVGVGFVADRGLTGADGRTGMVSGSGVEFAYAYDEQDGRLELDVEQFPRAFEALAPELRGARFEELVRAAMETPSDLLDRPKEAGVYNYVLPTIVNSCGEILTYGSASMDHGSITITTSRYDVGKTAQAFDARSLGGSIMGVGGRVVYTVGSGSPLVNIDFFLNGIGEYSFTVGLTGGNAYLFKADVTGTKPTLDSYTYLEPRITIERAS